MWRSEPEIVHPVDVEAAPGWSAAMRSTFFMDPDTGAEERLTALRRNWNPGHTWGVRDDERWVATLRIEPRTLTVPGAGSASELVAADAVTNVTVAPTHRRRGLLRAMLGGSLRAARERGDAVSILIAAEWPIYGRFGYAPAASSANYTFAVRRPGAAVAGDVSRVHQVDRAAFGQAATPVFEAFRRLRAGQVDRAAPYWERMLGLDGWPGWDELPHNWLLHEGDDGPDGLLAWTAATSFGMVPPLAALKVPLLAAAGDDAYRDLWAYLSGIDATDEIRLAGRPVDEPVRWLLGDGRTLLSTESHDELWLRILDVCAALSARRYRVPGELVLELVDETEVSVAGRYRLVTDGGEHAACAPTGDAPDLTLDQRALASLYLGGITLAERAIGGGVQEHTQGALRRADAMFQTALAPWNATGF